MEIELRLIKRNGEKPHIVKSNKPLYLNFIEKMKPGYYTMKIAAEKANKRSLMQNNYYYGVVVQIIQESLMELYGELLPFNITKQYTHELLRSKFLFYEIINEKTGEVERFPRSTTTLSKTEFEEFTEKCRQWALETLNVTIPLPNEEMELNF